MWMTISWGQNEGIQFFHGSWAEALEKAKSEQKPLFVDAYASWCGPCKRMAAQVFPQAEVGEFFNARFINVKMDMEKGEGPDFAKKFPVRAYPTLLFISPNEEKFHEHVGGLDAEGLLKTGDLAVRKYGGNSEFAAMYKEGNREFDVVQGYLLGLANSGQSAVEPANRYLRGEGADLSTEKQVEIAFAAATEADSRLFDMMVEHRDYLFSSYPEKEVLDKVRRACVATVDKAISFKAQFLMEEAVDKWYLFEDDRRKRTSFEAGSYLRYHAAHGSWSDYNKHLKAYVKTLPKGEVTERKRLAFEMIDAFGEPAYDAAKDLWKDVCEEESDVADNFYRLARVYAALGKISAAQTSLEKAIEKAGKDEKSVARYRAFGRDL
jgi:thiol-disulfide isomerase/thioredoxin